PISTTPTRRCAPARRSVRRSRSAASRSRPTGWSCRSEIRSMKAILALDQGTSVSKAALYDAAGRTIAVARVPLRTRYGPGGRADTAAGEILAPQGGAIRAALASAARRGIDVTAIGVASQRSTFVLWDRATGAPVAPAPTWQDLSARDRCRALSGHAAR